MYNAVCNKLLDISPVCIIPPSNDPVFIVGSDSTLCTRQPILAIIDPLIEKWPIVLIGLGSIDRKEEMEA